MFDLLNSVLFSYQLEPIVTSLAEREADSRKPCIVFLSEPEKRIPLLLSANRISPENAFVVSEPNWLKVMEDEGENVLYLLEGITMNQWGQCFYVKFKTPQKITCLCNFLTEENFSFSSPTWKQKAHEFRHYERLANCPMSSSTELNQYIDDKLHTRLLGVAAKINVPHTIAFSFCLDKYSHHGVSEQVKLINLSRKPSLEEMRTYLHNFPFAKFVIKPSGARWMGGKACTIESKDNFEVAVENLEKGLDLIYENECLLVEEFIEPSLRKDSQLGARLRILVSRRPSNQVQTSGILCSLGSIDQPINGDTSESFSLEYLANCMGLSEGQTNQLKEQLYQLGETMLASIIKYEDKYLNHLPSHQQTDFIGLDVFLRHKNGQIEPFLIEVNNCDCTSTLQLYEMQHSPHRNNILDKWVETMLYRSYQYMLKERNILILGADSEEKLKGCKWATKLGINLIFTENQPQSCSLGFPSQSLDIELRAGKEDMEKSLAIIEAIRRHQLTIKGIVALNQNCLSLATLVALFLPKPSNSYESVTLAKSQLLTSKKILIDEFEKQSFEARRFSHGVEVFRLNSLEDIHGISLDCYPLEIKLDSGNSNFTGQIVSTQEELRACFEEYQREFNILPDREKRLSSQEQLIATSSLKGLPQDVIMILSQGKFLGGYLIPTFDSNFNQDQEKIEIEPSFLDSERQENILYAARKVCHNLNLKEGIFYVRGISTELGAKILDINLLPWKMDLVQWMFQVWDIDLILYSCLIACGFKVYINRS